MSDLENRVSTTEAAGKQEKETVQTPEEALEAKINAILKMDPDDFKSKITEGEYDDDIPLLKRLREDLGGIVKPIEDLNREVEEARFQVYQAEQKKDELRAKTLQTEVDTKQKELHEMQVDAHGPADKLSRVISRLRYIKEHGPNKG